MTDTTKKSRGGQKSANYELNESFPSKAIRRIERLNKKNNVDSDESGNPLVGARLKKLLLEADKLQLDIDIVKRNYIPVIEVSTAVATEYTRVRSKLLTLESKLPHVLAPLIDPLEIKRIIQQEVGEILAELSYDDSLTN